jgi:hypothetical protein
MLLLFFWNYMIYTMNIARSAYNLFTMFVSDALHSYDILGVRMLWKPKEVIILTNFIDQPV